jgi:hypothetical protein
MTATGSATYEIHVQGHLDDHRGAWFAATSSADVTLRRHADGTTTLTCPVADQAQLYGVLAGLRDVGVTLLGVRLCHHPSHPMW